MPLKRVLPSLGEVSSFTPTAVGFNPIQGTQNRQMFAARHGSLLSSFGRLRARSEEENKLRSTLQPVHQERPQPQEQQQQQQQRTTRPRRQQKQALADQAPPERSGRQPVEKPLSRYSTRHSVDSTATNGEAEAGDGGAEGLFRVRSGSRAARGQEEKGGEVSEDDESLFDFTRTTRAVVGTVGTDRFVGDVGGHEAIGEFRMRPGHQLPQPA